MPGFRFVNEYQISKSDRLVVESHYRAPFSFRETADFYIAEMPKLGWSGAREQALTDWGKASDARELTFVKNGYQATIYYAGRTLDSLSSSEFNYTILISWPPAR